MILKFCPNPEDLGVSVGPCLIKHDVCRGMYGVEWWWGSRPKRVEIESEKGLTKAEEGV
jgi:hypothetical protein